jgi:hypothetical protein
MALQISGDGGDANLSTRLPWLWHPATVGHVLSARVGAPSLRRVLTKVLGCRAAAEGPLPPWPAGDDPNGVAVSLSSALALTRYTEA